MSTTTRQLALCCDARTALVVLVLAAMLAGCGDAGEPTAPASRPTSSAPPAMRTAVTASVDLEAGTMTFERASSSDGLNSTTGVSAAMYGNQGVTVRLYNGAVTVSASATPGKKQFSTMVGVRNLLPHSIGDEQSGSAASDTIGIDVFVVGEPSVKSTSSPCAVACTVTMRDHHGLRTFTAPNQKYWHWHELLGAAGSGTDTTRSRMRFTFETDTQVTNFRFTVVLNAPWPAPYETRYKVDYQADALPTSTLASPWKLALTGDAEVFQASGALTIDAKTGSAFYHRLDSLGQTQDAYMEARIQWNGVTQNLTEAEPRITITDGTRLISLGIFPNGAGFVNSSGLLVGTKYATVPTVYQTYQLRKYAADSAVFYVNGARGGVLDYASLPASPYGAETRMEFGATNAKKLTSSSWDYVVYEIGVPRP